MPRKHAPHDDEGMQLAEPVTPEQLAELAAMGYRGPTPSTQWQAAHVLDRWRQGQPTPWGDGR